jgi:predicted nucleic acid-binding protein
VFFLLWDASALTKRYVPENGHLTVDALFSAVPRTQMITSVLSYSETCAILVRKRNGAVLSTPDFLSGRSALQTEVINDPDFGILAVEFSNVLDGIDLIDRHNLNSADGSILATFLKFAQTQPSSTACVLVATDRRFLRAAQAEGLKTFNPETVAVADVPAFLAAL